MYFLNANDGHYVSAPTIIFLPQSYKNIYTKLYVYQFDLQYKLYLWSKNPYSVRWISAGYQGGRNTGFASCMLDVFVMPFVPEVFHMMYITLLRTEHLYNRPLLPLLRVPFLFGPPITFQNVRHLPVFLNLVYL